MTPKECGALLRTLHTFTGWRRLIGCLQFQVIFRKRADNYTALLRKITCTDKASYHSTPPCRASWRTFGRDIWLCWRFTGLFADVCKKCVAVNLQHGNTLMTRCNKATHCNILQYTARLRLCKALCIQSSFYNVNIHTHMCTCTCIYNHRDISVELVEGRFGISLGILHRLILYICRCMCVLCYFCDFYIYICHTSICVGLDILHHRIVYTYIYMYWHTCTCIYMCRIIYICMRRLYT